MWSNPASSASGLREFDGEVERGPFRPRRFGEVTPVGCLPVAFRLVGGRIHVCPGGGVLLDGVDFDGVHASGGPMARPGGGVRRLGGRRDRRGDVCGCCVETVSEVVEPVTHRPVPGGQCRLKPAAAEPVVLTGDVLRVGPVVADSERDKPAQERDEEDAGCTEAGPADDGQVVMLGMTNLRVR